MLYRVETKINILFLLLSVSVFGQSNVLDSIQHYNSNEDYERSIGLWKQHLLNQPDSKDPLLLMEVGNAYEKLNKEDSAFIIYEQALEKLNQIEGNSEKIAEVNFHIYSLLDGQNNISVDKEIYFEKVRDHANESASPKWLAEIANILAIKNFNNNDPEIPKKYFLDALNYFENDSNQRRVAGTYSNLGLLYLNKKQDSDSARHFFKKALEVNGRTSDIDTRWNIYLNLGNSFKEDKNYAKAIDTYLKADSLDIKKYVLNKKRLLYYHLQDSYRSLGDYKNSDHYLLEYDYIKDSINLIEQNKAIAEINSKYQTEIKEQENVQLQKEKRNLLIGGIAFLLFISFTALLLYKNTSKKRKLAEQQEQIQKQKVETLLKEQELASIDAMIAGQEKERQRVANELHDDLGSLMATIKLHFGNIKADKEDPALKNTHSLLDQAYQKIRGISHAKNAGVISKKGLLPAVQNMAKKISETNTLKIEVLDYGLEDRMENSLELTIFRIIQELITNIVKHARASKASIQFTQHDDSLNILVEDNGIGFKLSEMDSSTKGIGLHSIEKRVEHLGGSFTVDSISGKGSSIIIDIPI